MYPIGCHVFMKYIVEKLDSFDMQLRSLCDLRARVVIVGELDALSRVILKTTRL